MPTGAMCEDDGPKPRTGPVKPPGTAAMGGASPLPIKTKIHINIYVYVRISSFIYLQLFQFPNLLHRLIKVIIDDENITRNELTNLGLEPVAIPLRVVVALRQLMRQYFLREAKQTQALVSPHDLEVLYFSA